MAKWHVSPKTLKAGKCRARSVESCPCAKEEGFEQHFDNKAEAESASSKKVAEQFDSAFKSLSKNSGMIDENKLPKVKEAFGRLGYDAEADYDSLVKTINDKRTFEHLGSDNGKYRKLEWTDRANGIRYVFAADKSSGKIAHVQVIEHNSHGIYTQSDCNEVQKELNNIFSE